MKAKELAELLMKTPDYEVKVQIVPSATWDNPWPRPEEYTVDDIDNVYDKEKIIILDVD